MARVHTVTKGQSLYLIAKLFGVPNWRNIYDAAENESLRTRRPNPQVLHPGDEVQIPEAATSTASFVPLNVRTVVVRRQLGMQPIGIVLVDGEGNPLADKAYRVSSGGRLLGKGQTDSNGLLVEEVPIDVEKLGIEIEDYVWEINIAHLNPVEEDTADHGVSGMQGRLKNLGYYSGAIDGVAGRMFEAALQAFQKDYGLQVSGKPDFPTRSKLLDIHGS